MPCRAAFNALKWGSVLVSCFQNPQGKSSQAKLPQQLELFDTRH